jgi:hypothetical protein
MTTSHTAERGRTAARAQFSIFEEMREGFLAAPLQQL